MQKSLFAGSGAGPANARRARAALSLAALATAGAGVPACALIAGLTDHTLEQVDGGAGGSTSSTGTMTTGTAGSGGTGGSAPKPPGWPDSPTAYCSDGTTEIPCPTGDKAPSHGQDGDHRLNVPTYAVDAEGDPLVTDSITGLTWRSTPLSLMGHTEAEAFCASQKFANLDGWRLPTRIELLSLVDYGAAGARIDHLAFPKVAEVRLWTSTEHLVGNPPGTNFWTVDLGCSSLACGPTGDGPGNTHGAFYDTPLASLCVRGPALKVGMLGSPHDGTITDESTGLTWQSALSPAQSTTWLGALQYCRDTMNNNAFGMYTDWRLPSIKELQTLADDEGATPPAILQGIVAAEQGYVWSSTPVVEAKQPARAYMLFTYDGSTSSLAMTQSYPRVRCVRGGS